MRTFAKNNSFKIIKFLKNVFILTVFVILAARYYYAPQVHMYRNGYVFPAIVCGILIIIAQLSYDYYVNHTLLEQLNFKNWREKHIFMNCINNLNFDEDYLIKNLVKKNITNRSDVQRYLKNYEYYMKLQNIL